MIGIHNKHDINNFVLSELLKVFMILQEKFKVTKF